MPAQIIDLASRRRVKDTLAIPSLPDRALQVSPEGDGGPPVLPARLRGSLAFQATFLLLVVAADLLVRLCRR